MNCLNSCDEEFIRVEDNISYCDVTVECPSVYDYRYANGSCLSSCPSPYEILNLLTGGFFCDVPCPIGYFNTENGDGCVSSCEGEIKTRGDILYCNEEWHPEDSDKSFSTTIEVYLRYDISLAVFSSQGYFTKFISLLARFLKAFSNVSVHIVNIKEGSTIIESQVVLKSGSQDGLKSKANEMMSKLERAAESGRLNLDGIPALNHRFSNAIEDDKSSKKGLAIGLGVGLGVVAVALGAYLIYRYKKKQRLMRVKEASKAEGNNERRNGEIGPQQVNNSVSVSQALVGNGPGRIEVETDPLKRVEGGLDLEKNQLSEKEKVVVGEELDQEKVEEEKKCINEEKPQEIGNDQQEKKIEK